MYVCILVYSNSYTSFTVFVNIQRGPPRNVNGAERLAWRAPWQRSCWLKRTCSFFARLPRVARHAAHLRSPKGARLSFPIILLTPPATLYIKQW